jgi:hypothetical protein
MKLFFADIGELGWSLYLSAHLRWLKENGKNDVAIITFPDRKCLYRGIADKILDVPAEYYAAFKGEQSGFGIYPSNLKVKLKAYFNKIRPPGYAIPAYFNFECRRQHLKNRVTYKPYEYSKKSEAEKKILVLPRFRNHDLFKWRNLPRAFYKELIEVLCDKFPDYKVKTLGLNASSYDIGKIEKGNYINGIKESADLQDFIDECQTATAAVGSQSAPPKIALLQGVPTFMIGHEKGRHMVTDNWMETKAGFYKVEKTGYFNINIAACIIQIVEFMRECT